MSGTKIASQQRGFTLIEVLVVIFVVAILVALVIPAVLYAREASRRLTCLNNLKQIGIALSSYEATHKVYPQGTNGRFYSGQLMLLPQLEQQNIYNSVNFNTGSPFPSTSFVDGGSNMTVRSILMTVFCCPSDPDIMKNATTNYAWNGGLGLQQMDFVGSFASRATRNFRYIGPADITDGLSNTVAMSEWKIGHVNSSDDTSVVFRISISNIASYIAFVQKCQASDRQTTDFGTWTKGAEWYQGTYGSTLLNFNSPPNSLSCYYGNNSDFGDWPASSYHSQGVNVLFHDNHVEFYKNVTNLDVLKSISTRASSDQL